MRQNPHRANRRSHGARAGRKGYADLLVVDGFGDVTSGKPQRVGATGIEVVDKMLFEVQDSVAELKTAMTITTICSLVAAVGVVGLIVRTGRNL